MDIKDKIFSNTFFNSLNFFWSFLVTIILTPWIWGKFGVERYSLLLLASLISGYLVVFDFGGEVFITRQIANFLHKNKHEQINRNLTAAIFFYILLGGITTILLWVFAKGFLLANIRFPQYLYSQVDVLIKLGFIFAYLNFLGKISNFLLAGLQRYDISVKLNLGASAVNLIGISLILWLNPSIPLIFIFQNLLFLFAQIIAFIFATKLLSFKLAFFSLKDFKNFFNFGSQMQVLKIVDFIVSQMDSLFLVFFLSSTLLGFYQIASKIVNTIRGIPILLVSAFIPAVAQLKSQNEKVKIRKLYWQSNRYVSMLGTPLMIFICIFSPQIIRVWIGPSALAAVPVIRILSLAYIVNLLTAVGSTMYLGLGKPRLQLLSDSLQFILIFCLYLFFKSQLTFIGVSIITSIGLIFGGLYFLVRLHRQNNYSTILFLKEMLIKPVGACLIALVPALAISLSGLNSLLVLILEALVFLTIYALTLLLSKQLTEADKSFVFQAITKIR